MPDYPFYYLIWTAVLPDSTTTNRGIVFKDLSSMEYDIMPHIVDVANTLAADPSVSDIRLLHRAEVETELTEDL